VIHAFNERGLAALDPEWAGGRPRLISDEDIRFATATTRPAKLGCRFTHWSVCKLVDHLARSHDRRVVIGREWLRQILREHRVSFQRTRTWKESTDPEKEAKLDRIEEQVPEPVELGLRPVRATVYPPLPWQHLGAAVAPGAAARDLHPHPRDPLLPWLLSSSEMISCGVPTVQLPPRGLWRATAGMQNVPLSSWLGRAIDPPTPAGSDSVREK
jgi:transposase